MGRNIWRVIVFIVAVNILLYPSNGFGESPFDPQWKVGHKWTLCDWTVRGNVTTGVVTEIRSGKRIIDCIVEKKEIINGEMCWQILCRERRKYTRGLLFACRYWFTCNSFELLKISNFNYSYNGKSKNSSYGRDVIIRGVPANCMDGLSVPEISLSMKNVFHLRDGGEMNQLSEYLSDENRYRITVMRGKYHEYSRKKIDSMSEIEKIDLLDDRDKHIYYWNVGDPWWSECISYGNGKPYHVVEMVTPEWEKKYGKVKKP